MSHVWVKNSCQIPRMIFAFASRNFTFFKTRRKDAESKSIATFRSEPLPTTAGQGPQLLIRLCCKADNGNAAEFEFIKAESCTLIPRPNDSDSGLVVSLDPCLLFSMCKSEESIGEAGAFSHARALPVSRILCWTQCRPTGLPVSVQYKIVLRREIAFGCSPSSPSVSARESGAAPLLRL